MTNSKKKKKRRYFHATILIKNKKERLKKECADANVSYVSQGGYAVTVRQTKKKALVVVDVHSIVALAGIPLSESEYKQKLHEWNEHPQQKGTIMDIR